MSDLKPTTLRPGLLVALKTSIKGENVEYVVTEIEADHAVQIVGGEVAEAPGANEFAEEVDAIEADGGEPEPEASAESGPVGRFAKWETARTIKDAAEHETAVKVRSKARNLVCGVCAKSDFGLLCTEDKSEKLLAAIAEGSRLCDEFNATSKLTSISFNTLIGRVSPDDVLAVKAINAEIRELMTLMEKGILNGDVEGARKAAAQAKDMAAMLTEGASERVQEAVTLSRKALNKMSKAGVQAAEELSREAIASLINARTAFLDLEPVSEQDTDQPESEGRAVDFVPDGEPEAASAAPETFDPTGEPTSEEAFANFIAAGFAQNNAQVESGRGLDIDLDDAPTPDFAERMRKTAEGGAAVAEAAGMNDVATILREKAQASGENNGQRLDGLSNESLNEAVAAVKAARKPRVRKPKAA
jgi:hypothetical protein